LFFVLYKNKFNDNKILQKLKVKAIKIIIKKTSMK